MFKDKRKQKKILVPVKINKSDPLNVLQYKLLIVLNYASQHCEYKGMYITISRITRKSINLNENKFNAYPSKLSSSRVISCFI